MLCAKEVKSNDQKGFKKISDRCLPRLYNEELSEELHIYIQKERQHRKHIHKIHEIYKSEEKVKLLLSLYNLLQVETECCSVQQVSCKLEVHTRQLCCKTCVVSCVSVAVQPCLLVESFRLRKKG